MKQISRLIAALVCLLAPTFAFAQGALLQSGAVTAGHVPMYVTQGTGQAVVQDAGGAGGGGPGVGLSELSLTARGNGTPPYIGQGTGPLGTNFCDYDAPTTNPTGYSYLCFGFGSGSTLIAAGTIGSTPQLPLVFNVNGTAYNFPFTTGGILGPSTSVVGHVALWNNTVGTLLSDGGFGFTAGTTGQLGYWSSGTNLGGLNIGTGLAVGGSALNLQPAQPATIGGIESLTCAAHMWLYTISTGGVPSCSQPAFADISGSLSPVQCPNATISATGCVQGDNSTLTLTAGVIKCTTATASQIGCVEPDTNTLLASAGVIGVTPPIGMGQNIEFFNDGTATGMFMAGTGLGGGALWGYCTTTSKWKYFLTPPAITVTGTASGAGGNVQINFAATTRPFTVGQYISTSSIVGTTEANGDHKILAVGGSVGAYTSVTINVAFANAYVSGGRIANAVVAVTNDININGTPGQSISAGVTYNVGFAYLDSACTIGQLVLGGDYFGDPTYGWPDVGNFVNVPLVGALHLAATAYKGIQGQGNSEYLISWYNQFRTQWQSAIYPNATPASCISGCSTSGNSWVVLTIPPVANTNPGSQIQVLTWGNSTSSVNAEVFATVNSSTAQLLYAIGLNSTTVPTAQGAMFLANSTNTFNGSVRTGTQGVATVFNTFDLLLNVASGAGVVTCGVSADSLGSCQLMVEGVF